MSNDLTKRPDPVTPKRVAEDAASRLKHGLMADALWRMFGTEKPIAPGTPRVLLALANHARGGGWDRAKVLQRQMFEVAVGSGLEMKFAFYAEDDDEGVRRCRITTRWITNPDDMAGVMDRAECTCGCFVNVRDVLAQAVKEAQDQPLRMVIIVCDVLHDGSDGLVEAAICANQLRRAGTKVILLQQSDDAATTHRLQYLVKVLGAVHFSFGLRTHEQQFWEMWQALSAYAAGGEEAVKKTGGQAATLLLEHFKQQPMPVITETDRVQVKSDSKE